jgi:hypothetical protein
MRIIILISSLLIVILSNAQNHKYTIGIISGIDYYNYSFWGFPDTYTIAGRTEVFPEGEHKFRNVLNMSNGFKFEYNLNKILIGTNIMYSSKDYNIEYDMPEIVNGRTNIAYETSYLEFRYFDFSVIGGYNLLQGTKINIIPMLGFNYNILSSSGNKIRLTNNELSVDEYNDKYVQHIAEKNLYSITGAVSFRLALGYRIKLILTPYFAQYLNQLEKEAMNKNPMAYGVRYGAVYCFGKTQKTE